MFCLLQLCYGKIKNGVEKLSMWLPKETTAASDNYPLFSLHHWKRRDEAFSEKLKTVAAGRVTMTCLPGQRPYPGMRLLNDSLLLTGGSFQFKLFLSLFHFLLVGRRQCVVVTDTSGMSQFQRLLCFNLLNLTDMNFQRKLMYSSYKCNTCLLIAR